MWILFDFWDFYDIVQWFCFGCLQMFSFTTPDSGKLPSIPSSVSILGVMNSTVDKSVKDRFFSVLQL